MSEAQYVSVRMERARVRDARADRRDVMGALGTTPHFVSPIRRYADVVVHRQLHAALEREEKETSEGDGNGSGGKATEAPGKRQTPRNLTRTDSPSVSAAADALCRARRSRRSPRRSTNVPARVNARNRGARSSISSRCFANDRRWNPRWSTTCATSAPSCFFLAFTSAAPFDSRDAGVPRVPSYPPSERRGSRRTRPRARGAREDTSAPSRPTPTRTFDSNDGRNDIETRHVTPTSVHFSPRTPSTGSERARTSTTHTRVGADVRGGPPRARTETRVDAPGPDASRRRGAAAGRACGESGATEANNAQRRGRGIYATPFETNIDRRNIETREEREASAPTKMTKRRTKRRTKRTAGLLVARLDARINVTRRGSRKNRSPSRVAAPPPTCDSWTTTRSTTMGCIGGDDAWRTVDRTRASWATASASSTGRGRWRRIGVGGGARRVAAASNRWWRRRRARPRATNELRDGGEEPPPRGYAPPPRGARWSKPSRRSDSRDGAA